MRKMTALPLFTASVLLLVAGTAAAQELEPCTCDCYFGSDCEPGFFCDWGDTLFEEDSCWWRTPKPEGVIGAGCESDWPQWGKCDGVCAPTAASGAVHPHESHGSVIGAGEEWGRIFNELSMSGGGAPSPSVLSRFEALELAHERTIYDVWRVVTEVMILSRGEAYVIFPEGDYTMFGVAVAELRGDPARKRNGDLAVAALMSEIAYPGSGMTFLREVDEGALDEELLRRICRSESASLIECLHQRIYDLGRAMDTHSGGADGGYDFPCPACVGDCVPNDAIDFADLLHLLSAWGIDEPCAEFDGSGAIGLADLLELLTRFGNCVPDP